MTAQRACGLDELQPDTAVKAMVDGEDVAIVRVGEDIYAIRDECSHAAVALSDGDVEGCEIECFLHGSRFDLRTGKPVTFPATEAVPVYPVTVDGDDVYVDVANPLN